MNPESSPSVASGTGVPPASSTARRVIVCGSRGWHDRQMIADALGDAAVALGTCDLIVVVGYDPELDRPKGADRIGYQEAQKHGFLVEPHPARWDDFGKRAGLVRNEEMAALGASLCIAFWDRRSTGTAHMIDRAREAGITVWTYDKNGYTPEDASAPEGDPDGSAVGRLVGGTEP